MAVVVFCGSGRLGEVVLETLLASPHHVTGVVTGPPAKRGRMGRGADLPVAALAAAENLPMCRPEAWDADVSVWVSGAHPDALAVADFGLRLPVADLPPAFNVHPSLLPRWRGAAPVPRAILAGDEVSGATVIRMVDRMDAGPILAQEATPIGEGEDAGMLLDRLGRIGARLLVTVLDEADAGTLSPVEQDSAAVTVAQRLRRGEERVDASHASIVDLVSRVRAFSPRPGLKVDLAGEEVALLEVRPADEGAGPGRVRAVAGRLILGVADGAVEIVRLRPAGRREMSGRDYANGLGARGGP